MSSQFDRLQSRLAGQVRTDRLARALYATDGSIYEIVPDAIAVPRHADDVIAAVNWCREEGVPLTPRGAGTGLTGAAINRGLVLDVSRHMGAILEIDPQRRTARVEPGVVLDELNAQLAKHKLQFAPDVATSSRATLGGMIANNSCGAHSVYYGRTVDHLIGLDVVLADGSRCTWSRDAAAPNNPLAAQCDAVLGEILRTHAAHIADRFPKVMRSNGGYALDRLMLRGDKPSTERLLCGSEGTLAVIVGATLSLEPLPKCRGIVLAQFDHLLDSLRHVDLILGHKPAAIELIDDLIIDATKRIPNLDRRRWFVKGAPAGVLICELYDEDPERLRTRLNDLERDLATRNIGRDRLILTDPVQQGDVWEIRKAGFGLLMNRPGEEQSYEFIEDAAVPTARLAEYIERLDVIAHEEGVTEIGHYAHASVGVIHVRPVLNLRRAEAIDRFARIADRVSTLVREFGGAMTGEHGDGIVRSPWHEKIYGPELVAAFRRIKHTFDPAGILNPGKIIDALPFTENLRYGPEYRSVQLPTMLDFGAYGGMAGLAGMCSGVGQCRQRLVGTMCPSYMATNDETHTTRARANALRLALSNRDLLEGLADPALDEVMDLCLSCKACKSDCPTGTDMAKLKAEWLHQKNLRRGVPRRSRLIAASVEMARWGSHFAPLANLIMQSGVTRTVMEYLFGLDRRVPPPKFAAETFRDWFAGRGETQNGAGARDAHGGPLLLEQWSDGEGGVENPLLTEQWHTADRPPVILFADTWTNFYQPGQGRAAVRVLEALGYAVHVLPTRCCGRPMISKGLLDEAQALAVENVELLGPYAERGIPIVGIEPSCVSTMLDEWVDLVRKPAARAIAGVATTIEQFAARHLQADPHALRFRSDAPRVLYHGHCHQKAMWGTAEALALLKAATGGKAAEINSGCCGMAGSFGHEAEHYDVAKAVGEQRLFPAIRAREGATIAMSGFSCRHQIGHHTDAHPRHVIEIVADALDA